MKCIILHESRGFLRVHVNVVNMSLDEADILEEYLNKISGVKKSSVSHRTSNAIIEYKDNRDGIIDMLSKFSYKTCDIVVSNSSRALNVAYEEKLYWHIFNRAFNTLFMPFSIRRITTLIKAVPFIWKGLKSLLKGNIEVALLDATTIGVSIARNDFSTASNIIFLLGFSDILEEWTHKKSISDLANAMAVNVDKVWLKNEDSEVLVSIKEIKKGDQIVVLTSNTIPLDGIVVDGEMSVNESSMTGESLPVLKRCGSSVYAGTIVDEGQCIIRVTNTSGCGRVDSIVKMIEESEKLKSNAESKAVHLSDRLVPYSFVLTGLTYLFTKNVTKALAVLMVDYSCALKLSMPISVLSAIKEASYHHISVKGGKFLEAVSDANTIVFDKTGTLTYSLPSVYKVVPFGELNEDECLRLAACLEEHFPHSIANAVINKAKEKDLFHNDELHAKVEYLVAHGIASTINEKRVIIGSYHFVFEDEKCVVDLDKQEEFNNLPDEYSHLYMAIDGRLAAVVLIEDPIRQEAKEVIDKLHKVGFDKVVMMTGDSYRTAKAVALKVGIDEFKAEVLPEDKANFIKDEHKLGRIVVMVGDGINDSPALSEADCGIAVSDGAAIAREIADVTISEDNLYTLLTLKELADSLMDRIHSNYRFIMGFNSGLILLGVFGILTGTTTAYLHNVSTLLISMHSTTNLLKD